MIRRLLAGVGGFAAGVALLFTVSGHERVVALMPLALCLLAALTVHSDRLGPQLFSRAVWWSNLVLGVLICLVGSRSEVEYAAVMVAGTASALAVVGQRGIGEAGERMGFAPTAFRTTLFLLLMLVMADAQTLGLFALLLGTEKRMTLDLFAFGAGATAYVVAFVGLLRLRVWGALVSVGASVMVIAVLALGTNDFLKDDIRLFVGALCAVQIVVAAPMLVAIVTKKSLPSLPPRARAISARVALGLMFVVAVLRVIAKEL